MVKIAFKKRQNYRQKQKSGRFLAHGILNLSQPGQDGGCGQGKASVRTTKLAKYRTQRYHTSDDHGTAENKVWWDRRGSSPHVPCLKRPYNQSIIRSFRNWSVSRLHQPCWASRDSVSSHTFASLQTCQFVIFLSTLIFHHFFTLSSHAQHLTVSKILPAMTFPHLLDWFRGFCDYLSNSFISLNG